MDAQEGMDLIILTLGHISEEYLWWRVEAPDPTCCRPVVVYKFP